jgi:hypothetical protein
MNDDVDIIREDAIRLEKGKEANVELQSFPPEVNTHKLITDDNEWTPNLENLVKTWALQSVLQREMHGASAKKYKILSGRITIPLILLTTLTSVGSFGAVDSEQYKIWMYVTGALNLLSAFLASMLKYLKPDEKCSTHMRISKLYDSFYREIVIQLSLAPEERENAEQFIQIIKEKLERLMNDSPIIADDISSKILTKHNIKQPDDFKIVIHGRESSENTDSSVDKFEMKKNKRRKI